MSLTNCEPCLTRGKEVRDSRLGGPSKGLNYEQFDQVVISGLSCPLVQQGQPIFHESFFDIVQVKASFSILLDEGTLY